MERRFAFSDATVRMMRLAPVARYGFAVVATVLSVLLRFALDPVWGSRHAFIVFWAGVVMSGWVGGFWPGVLATVLSAQAAEYFWLEPGRLLPSDPGDAIALLLFVLWGILVSALNETWRRAAAGLADSAERLRELQAATDSARVEAEMSARQLSLAFEAGRMGMWQWTIGTGEVKWSPGLEAIHGFAKGTFPGTIDAFREEIHPDDRERVLRAVAGAVEERRDHHVEYRIVRTDGAVRWVEGRGQLLCDAAGRPERLVGVCLDVTERKRAEEQFRLAVEAAPAAMILVDQRGTIVLVNDFTERLLGYAREELVGRSVDTLVPHRLGDRHAEHRATFFADARQRPMGAGRELHALRKDGTEVPVEIGLSPVEAAEGVFVLAAVTDITERKRTEEEREAARAEMERASHLKDEFLAMLSHELRTPLNAILGYVQLLESGILSPERATRALEAIGTNARNQERLVGSLLDLSRIAAGKLELDLEPVDLSAVVLAAVEVVRPTAEAKGLSLQAPPPPAPIPLVADAGRLQQVFWNLLSNAVKFTPRGGRVLVHVAQLNGQVEVQVADDGQGIHAEFLPHVFDRYKQAGREADPSRAGLGLGLALVDEIVRAHGGAVLARSDGPGKGSVFTVTLPLTAAPPMSVGRSVGPALRARPQESPPAGS